MFCLALKLNQIKESQVMEYPKFDQILKSCVYLFSKFYIVSVFEKSRCFIPHIRNFTETGFYFPKTVATVSFFHSPVCTERLSMLLF